MKSTSKLFGSVAACFMATCNMAYAAPNFLPQAVPEPDSIALVVLGIAGVMLFSRKRKKQK
jgi:hypothetical protein